MDSAASSREPDDIAENATTRIGKNTDHGPSGGPRQELGRVAAASAVTSPVTWMGITVSVFR